MKRPVRGEYAKLIAITHRVTKYRVGEGCEIGIRDMENQLVAVITHPKPGAKWFVHWAYPQDTILLAEAIIDEEASELSPHAKIRFGFRTQKAALSHVHHNLNIMRDRAEKLTES